MTQLYMYRYTDTIRAYGARSSAAQLELMSTSTCPCIVFRNEMDQSHRKVTVDTYYYIGGAAGCLGHPPGMLRARLYLPGSDLDF